MNIPSHIRVPETQSDIARCVMELLRELSSNETATQVLHQALHDGLMLREKKLTAILKRDYLVDTGLRSGVERSVWTETPLRETRTPSYKHVSESRGSIHGKRVNQ